MKAEVLHKLESAEKVSCCLGLHSIVLPQIDKCLWVKHQKTNVLGPLTLQ